MKVSAMCLNQSCPSYKICWKAQAPPKLKQLYDRNMKVLEGNTRCWAYEEMRSKDDNGSGRVKAVTAEQKQENS